MVNVYNNFLLCDDHSMNTSKGKENEDTRTKKT